jgi:hypothetical protein
MAGSAIRAARAGGIAVHFGSEFPNLGKPYKIQTLALIGDGGCCLSLLPVASRFAANQFKESNSSNVDSSYPATSGHDHQAQQ